MNNSFDKNLKYKNFFSYDNEIVYDNGLPLPSTHYIYTILTKYKIPGHITNVKIIDNKTIDEADNNLVFFGTDRTGKTQYFYGERHVSKRKEKKLDVFLNVRSKIKSIKDEISQILHNGIHTKQITKDFLISAIIELEMSTFIRLGKNISYENNGTFGIRNLKKENINIYTSYLTIEFIGKKKVIYEYKINKKNNLLLYDTMRFLKFQNNNSEYLFSNHKYDILSEYNINSYLNNIDITFKDLRLYGTNYIFFETLFEKFKDNPKIETEKDLNNILKNSINQTASIIQHTPSISKNSYIIDIDVTKLFKNINLLFSINNIDFFIDKIILILQT